jgi:acetyltransferase-like isoleucine patch superfamily enzyme
MAVFVAATAIVHPGVVLGDGSVVEDFCVIGAPPRGRKPGDIETVIGAGAHIRTHTVIYAGNVIGDRLETGHKANIREENRIGDDFSLGTLSVVEHHVTIGNGVRIHTQAFVPEYCTLEDRCWIGPHVVLTNMRYPATPDAKASLRGVIVRAGGRIGANSTILPGIEIGAGALVGAGSIVAHDVPAGAVVHGRVEMVTR